MAVEILAVDKGPLFDDSITHFEYHTHAPYASTRYGNNDEIRIPVHQQDVFTLPTESFLYIEGKLTKKDGTEGEPNVKLVNNAMAFLFEEIRYELAGVEVDRTKNVGITTTMKNLLSINERDIIPLNNACWTTEDTLSLVSPKGEFNFCLPLKMLMGFAEDYKRIVMNVKQELTLLRSSPDVNALVKTDDQGANGVLEIQKIYWKIPYVHVANVYRLALLDVLNKDRALTMAFRSWELYEYPLLPQTTRQTWTVKTSSQLERPRYVILAFQTGRKNDISTHAEQFDHCKLTNVRLFLNDKYYPYDNLNLDIVNGRFALLYDMYARFQHTYYNRHNVDPVLSPTKFLSKAPLYVIDCSRQDESLKSSSVDVRLEFEASESFPANTTAFCLILHDSIVEYKPLSNTVRRIS